jgi:hypothetical protein
LFIHQALRVATIDAEYQANQQGKYPILRIERSAGGGSVMNKYV